VTQAFRVVHVLKTCKPPKHGLPQQTDQRMPAVLAGAGVGEHLARHRAEAERIVEFPVREQAGIGGFKDWVLPASMERVRRKLNGADDGNRQMVDILTAVLTDGLPAVEAACAEAIAHGVHSADVVLNILARQRDPGPPATILTPTALTLRHAPIADCARYDNLRRTI
jgi:hypothetical protein